MKIPRISEDVARFAIGGVLWMVSGLLTVDLFLAFALGNPLRQLVLFVLAAALEGAKILSWRMGRGYRLLAGVLIILSGLGSFGASLETVQSYRAARTAAISDAPSMVATKREVGDLDRQIDILLGRLAALPPDFVTAGKDLNKTLDELRAQRSRLSVSLSEAPVEASEATMFDLMAKVFGLPVETLMLILLVFLAVCLEASALVMAGHGTPVGPRPTDGTEEVVTSQKFLETAKEGAPLPLLHGRDVTARKLGISGYLAKKLVRELRSSGTIKVSGKRLVLTRYP